jgi:RHS repeat-associated protein
MTIVAAAYNSFTFVGQFGVVGDIGGQDLMRSRMYNPDTGRFTQPDPIGIEGMDANDHIYIQQSN